MIWIILFTSLLILVTLTYVAWKLLENPGPKYDEGAQFLNSIADKLGRTSQNQISFRHPKSRWGALCSYDSIEIIFYTDKTPAQLATEIKSLESTLNEKGVLGNGFVPDVPDIEPIQSLQISAYR